MSENMTGPQGEATFVASLYPYPDVSRGADRPKTLIRFGLLAGAGLREIATGVQPFPVIEAVVCPELPRSVLPRSVLLRAAVTPTEELPLRPTEDTFRGIPCVETSLTLWLRNEALERGPLTAFDVPVLLPDVEVPDVTRVFASDDLYLLLGQDFCLRERMRVAYTFDTLAQAATSPDGLPNRTTRCGLIVRQGVDEP